MADQVKPQPGDLVEVYGRIRKVDSVTDEHIVFKVNGERLVMSLSEFYKGSTRTNQTDQPVARQDRVTQF